MTTLLEKQKRFALLIAQLIVWIYSKGWEITLAEGYDDDFKGHMKGSLHYSKLAQDVNLFINDDWIIDGDDPRWLEVGEKWEAMDPLCRWGGRFKDANHFSLTHNGKA